MRWMSLVVVVLALTACGGGANDAADEATTLPAAGVTTSESAPVSEPAKATAVYWPTDGWRTSTPEEQGMDSAALAELIEYLDTQSSFRIHSLLIIRNGYIVADAAFYPYPADTLHDLASVTKSFTSTLIGIAIDEGYVESVDEPVVGFFPDRMVANLDAAKEAMTVENLLTMRSGFACTSHGGGSTDEQMWASPDWVQFSLDLPMATEPGAGYNYCSQNSHLLSAIVQETTGMNALAFAEEHLIEPLGIGNTVWPTDPQGVSRGWGEMKMAPRDMAKLGYLFLNEGVWEDKQVVSAEWVEAATVPEQSTTYGYQWWLKPEYGAYWATGVGGQNIFVVPDKELIVVTTGATGGGGTGGWGDALLTSRILPLAESARPLPANPAGVAALESAVEAAAVSMAQPLPVPPLPDVALDVDGRQIALEPNPLGLAYGSLAFLVEEGEAVLTLSPSDGDGLAWVIGLDNVERFFPLRDGMLAAAKGEWESDNVFVIYVDEIGNRNTQVIKVTFEGEEVTIHSRTEPAGEETLIGQLEN